MKHKKFWLALLMTLSLFFTTACGSDEDSQGQDTGASSADFVISDYKGEALKIVAGSENKLLEPIIENYAQQEKKNRL